MTQPSAPIEEPTSLGRRLFLLLFIAFAFLLPLKFGNPIVLESLSTPPHGAWDWFFSMWPNQIAILGAFLLLGVSLWVDKPIATFSPRAFWLPCAFLVTQLASMPGSVTPQVSLDTVVMFGAGLACYAIGLRQLGGARERNGVITVLILSMLIVCFTTSTQYFGGLEETKQYFKLYYSQMDVSPDYLIKLGGNRPFATFVYPNSLAGFLVLVLPVLVARIWMLRSSWEHSAVRVALVAVTGLVMFSLVLSGSKGGFLALAGVVVVAVFSLPFPKRVKAVLVIALVICGIALAARYGSDFVRYGLSTSSARVNYWRAGVRIFADYPWLGTGPGTFGSVYPKYKVFSSEDPRLAHNNFLEALSDSGIFGFVAYAALWLWPIAVSVRRFRQTSDPMLIGLTLSLIAWVLHGLVDFDQYIPSLALLAFLFLGMLENRLHLAPKLNPMPTWLKAAVSVLALLICLLPVFRLRGQYQFGLASQLTRSNPYAAAKALNQASSLSPLDAFYEAQAARLEIAMGHYEGAALRMSHARSLDPFRPSYSWETAELYRRQEGLSAAYFSIAEQAVALAPQNVLYHQRLAQDYAKVGDMLKSKAHWKVVEDIKKLTGQMPQSDSNQSKRGASP